MANIVIPERSRWTVDMDPALRTDDGYVVEVGGIYFNNNLDVVEVTKIGNDGWHDAKGIIGWEGTLGKGSGIFDGRRLSASVRGETVEATLAGYGLLAR